MRFNSFISFQQIFVLIYKKPNSTTIEKEKNPFGKSYILKFSDKKVKIMSKK